MSKFLMVMHFTGDYPTTEEGQAEMQQAWGGWYGSLGPAIVDAGGQGGRASTVTGAGSTDTSGSISGYVIVDAADLDAAVALAQGNPIVAGNQGSVEVVEVIEMG